MCLRVSGPEFLVRALLLSTTDLVELTEAEDRTDITDSIDEKCLLRLPRRNANLCRRDRGEAAADFGDCTLLRLDPCDPLATGESSVSFASFPPRTFRPSELGGVGDPK